MAENVPVAAQRFNAVFPAIMCLYCAAIFFDVFDKMLERPWGDAGDGYTFESDERDSERDAHVSEGRFVERERAAMASAPERSQKGGRGMPVLLELGKRDVGSEGSEMRDASSGGDDVESRGLLNRRAARGRTRGCARSDGRETKSDSRTPSAEGQGTVRGSPVETRSGAAAAGGVFSRR